MVYNFKHICKRGHTSNKAGNRKSKNIYTKNNLMYYAKKKRKNIAFEERISNHNKGKLMCIGANPPASDNPPPSPGKKKKRKRTSMFNGVSTVVNTSKHVIYSKFYKLKHCYHITNKYSHKRGKK